MNKDLKPGPHPGAGRRRGTGFYSPLSFRWGERMIPEDQRELRYLARRLTRALEEAFPDRGPREALLIRDIVRIEILLMEIGAAIGKGGIPALPNKRGEYLSDYCRLLNLKRQAILALGPVVGRRISEALAPYELSEPASPRRAAGEVEGAGRAIHVSGADEEETD
jgi:hypothetical protein